MKKKLLTLVLFSWSAIANAQLTVSPNPFSITSGTITISYGSDYSLFDPQSDPNLYLYTGLETDGNASTWDYFDDWNNTSSLIPLTYNAGLGYYTATFNLTNHSYTQGVVANGTQVNNWFFIIRNGAGNRQSGNLQGTNYGFQPTTFLSVSENIISKQDFTFKNGEISTSLNGNTSVEIFNLLGQKVANLSINQNERKAILLQKNQMYIAVVSNQQKKGTFKFIN